MNAPSDKRLEDRRAEELIVGAVLDANGPLLRSNARALLEEVGLTPADFMSPEMATYLSTALAISDAGQPATPGVVAAVTHGLPGVPLDDDERARKLEVLHAANTLNRENFRAVGQQVRRLSILRKLEAHHRAQLNAIAAHAQPSELMGATSAFMSDMDSEEAGLKSGEYMVAELDNDWRDALDPNTPRPPYLETGIEILDRITPGYPCNICVEGGAPKSGKTAKAATSIGYWLTRRKPIPGVIFGLEDGARWLIERHIARRLDIAYDEVGRVRLTREQLQEYDRAKAEWYGLLKSHVQVYDAGSISPEKLVRLARKAVVNGAKWVVIDNGSEVRHLDGVKGKASERLDFAIKTNISRLRDEIAIRGRVPVILLWHLNRRNQGQGLPPQMEDFKESGYLESIARRMDAVWRHPEKPEYVLNTLVASTRSVAGVTVAIPSDLKYGLLQETGGHVVDFAAEARAKAEAKRAEKGKRTYRQEYPGGDGD